MMKLKSLAPALLLLVFASCKKDETNTCGKTMADIAGTYSITRLQFERSGGFVDFTASLDNCNEDDKLILNANGTSIYQDAGVACDPPENAAGTWSIDSEGRMSIDDGGSDVFSISTAEITSFDCNTLVLTGTSPGFAGFSFRLTIKK